MNGRKASGEGTIIIGTSKYDKSAQHSRLSHEYPALSTAPQVRLLLADCHALNLRAEAGDYAAIDVLADLGTAIKRAGLTRRQREALHYVYVRDMTQVDAGKVMGVSRQNVSDFVSGAETKIAEVYYYWAGHREGYDQ